MKIKYLSIDDINGQKCNAFIEEVPVLISSFNIFIRYKSILTF